MAGNPVMIRTATNIKGAHTGIADGHNRRRKHRRHDKGKTKNKMSYFFQRTPQWKF